MKTPDFKPALILSLALHYSLYAGLVHLENETKFDFHNITVKSIIETLFPTIKPKQKKDPASEAFKKEKYIPVTLEEVKKSPELKKGDSKTLGEKDEGGKDKGTNKEKNKGKEVSGGLKDPAFDGFINQNQTFNQKTASNNYIVEKDPVTGKNTIYIQTLAGPEEKCEDSNSFGGIGIQLDSFIAPGSLGLLVKNSPEYYPAYEAGIRPGDLIITPLSEIQGKPGTFTNVTFSQNNVLKSVKIKRSKICYKKKKLNL
jgi:hypothetical protein